MTLLNYTTLRHLLALAIVLTGLGAVLGYLISTNAFSLQYLWRNRIIRAYLGASHFKRHPEPFTGFDSYDNLQMHELWPQPGAAAVHACEKTVPSDDLKPVRDSKKLFHILNIALNLAGGEKLQWQDRKAESFTVSPLHAGSYWLGYRRSRYYGGNDGITLGASIAISGAFVSPNMGFMMTSPVVRFLMAVFNVRFGWWLGNPGAAGDKTFQHDSPLFSVLSFLNEAIGNTDDKSPYVYLSDGGHFENLGLYEMVLRRCRFIVVCDATTDPVYSFESLAQSIRQIRVDLGVPIDIPEMAVGVPSQNLKSKYCAIGRIRYSCVDNTDGGDDDDYDGVLIFIKPSLIGQEPRDVINYWQGSASFPQEAITDQWFSESQFESYRALGSYIIEAICREKGTKSCNVPLETFAQKAHEHNLLNFDAFREQIGLVALEHEFKGLMQQTPVNTYQDKVREFMNRLLRLISLDPPTRSRKFLLCEIYPDDVRACGAYSSVWSKSDARCGAGFIIVETLERRDELLAAEIRPARVSPSTKIFAVANAASCDAVCRGTNLYFSCNERNSATASLLRSAGKVGNAMKILFLNAATDVGSSLPLMTPRKNNCGVQLAAAASLRSDDCSFPAPKKRRLRRLSSSDR